MYEIDIERDFSAAHYLRGYNGDCSCLHGHNWVIQVVAKAEKLDEIGIAIDFKRLKAELEFLLDGLDHKNLNDLDYFKEANPTAENLAKIIFDLLSEKVNNGNVAIDRVRVCESPRSGATYYKS
jgi:6-pyruvoyltetrahydropterin/6-carboxytetrahydropterin synthase